MFTLKQLNEKLGEARKRKTELVEDRASKLDELEGLMNKKNPDQDKIEAKQSEIDDLKSDIQHQNNLIENYTDQIADLSDVEEYKDNIPEGGFHFDGSPSGEEKELQQFDFMNAIRQAKSGRFEGFTKEMNQEGVREAKEAGVTLNNPGESLVIPQKVLKNKKLTNVDRRRVVNDVQAGGSGNGSETVETEDISFVGLLYDALILRQLGARFATGLQGNIPLTNQSSGFTFGWASSENATASESTPAYSQATLSPKRGTGFMDVSNQYLVQTSPDMQRELVMDMLNATRVGIETAAVNGSGSSGEPEGILNKTGIGAVYAGGAAGSGTNADGAAQVWGDWVNLEKAVAIDNANQGSLGYLTNSKVKAQARLTKVDSGSGIFIWDKLMAEDARIGISNIVPDNLSKGTSSELSAAVYGNFDDLWIGQWGGLEVMRNPYTKAKDGITEMIIHVYIDVAIRRAESFAAVQDIDAQ